MHPSKPMPEREYFILSVERTGQPPWGGRCVWWRPGAMGYTTSIVEAGRYTLASALMHSDPPHHVFIPCDAVEVPASKAKGLVKKGLRVSKYDRELPPAFRLADSPTDEDLVDEDANKAQQRGEGAGR